MATFVTTVHFRAEDGSEQVFAPGDECPSDVEATLRGWGHAEAYFGQEAEAQELENTDKERKASSKAK